MSFVDKLKEKLSDAIHTLDIADDNVVENRMATCASCEYFTQLRRCKQCGCFMDAKTKLKNSSCPINKW
jgi:hypothetical protein